MLAMNKMLKKEILEPSVEVETFCDLLKQHVAGFTKILSQLITMEAILHLASRKNQLFV
jgi:hypothetical protein